MFYLKAVYFYVNILKWCSVPKVARLKHDDPVAMVSGRDLGYYGVSLYCSLCGKV